MRRRETLSGTRGWNINLVLMVKVYMVGKSGWNMNFLIDVRNDGGKSGSHAI